MYDYKIAELVGGKYETTVQKSTLPLNKELTHIDGKYRYNYPVFPCYDIKIFSKDKFLGLDYVVQFGAMVKLRDANLFVWMKYEENIYKMESKKLLDCVTRFEEYCTVSERTLNPESF